MRRYIARRLLAGIPILIGVSFITFYLMRVMPGDVAVLMLLGGDAGGDIQLPAGVQEKIVALRAELRLDLPIPEQYALWLWDALHGDLGESYWQQESVTEAILRAFPVTLELAVLTLLVAELVAMPVAIISALRQDTWRDYAGRLFSIIGLAIPEFWLATLAILLPLLWFGWIPPIMFVPIFEDPVGHLALFAFPAMLHGVHYSSETMRMLRSSLLEVLRQDYIRTAYAKGLRESRVVWRHALKNAFIPVVTLLGLRVGRLLGGTVIIEVIFGLPGMGRLLVDSLNAKDFPVVQGVVLFFAVTFVVTNLVVDVVYSWLDPRIRYA